MENIKSGDEELVSVLLLVAGQVPGVGPDEVKEFERNVRSDLTGIELNVVWCGGVCMGMCTCVWMESGIGNEIIIRKMYRNIIPRVMPS